MLVELEVEQWDVKGRLRPRGTVIDTLNLLRNGAKPQGLWRSIFKPGLPLCCARCGKLACAYEGCVSCGLTPET